ncbi:hypothetical protein [Streptomyces sp. NPDC047725]|uniref:hypothetical protein n=1 Tax=Streptomyces sp. NPDC047725 TaxID=3365487 RepID=UPI0037144F3F
MTGIPTQFALADVVLDSLRAGGGPAPDDADLPFYYLGATGPTLGNFMPTRLGTSSTRNAPLFDVWSPVLGLLAGTRGTPPTPGLSANVLSLKDTLRRLRDVVRDKDKFDLLDMKSELEALPALVAKIMSQVSGVGGLRSAVQTAIGAARPRVKQPPVTDRDQRDVLHGHHVSAFWDSLQRRAAASPDPRLRAFGLGICVGYAGPLCGNPYINGVVGAPYRNHWWRHQWVSQYVDAWVWGYDRTRRRIRLSGQEIVFPPPPAALTGNRVPVPPYQAWQNIAGAELQERFAIGGITPTAVLDTFRDGTPFPGFLPAELVTLWLDCYSTAHGTGDPVDASGLQEAYALLWLTTWLNSSEALFGATPPQQVNDPDDCGARPPWVNVDGSVVVGGTTVRPPDPAMPDPSVSELASGIAAAILGGIAFLLSAGAAGIASIVAAVALVDDATDPDWDELRCHTGWVNSYLEQLDIAFRDLLLVTGLGPPYAEQLAHNEIQFQSHNGAIVPDDAALNTCRSPSAREGKDYPAGPWNGATSDWTSYPSGPPEAPRTMSYPEGSWFPRHFLDGLTFIDNGSTTVPRYTSIQTNPLDSPMGKPSVLDPAEWEERMSLAEAGDSRQKPFGNAVAVALALLGRSSDQKLLDWDLDGDRGIGWPTWVWNPSGPGVVRE